MKFLLPVALLWLAATAPLHGAETVVLSGSVDKVSTDAWAVSGFDSTIELTTNAISGRFRIARITLLESGQIFDDTRVACALIELSAQTIKCANASFAFMIPGIGRQTTPGAFTYDRHTGAATVQLSGLAVAGGKLRCNITAGDTGISVRYTGTRLQLAGLVELANLFTDSLAGYSANGVADVSGTFAMPAAGPTRLTLIADLADVAFANDAGTIATDGVAGKLELELQRDDDIVRFTINVDSDRGEAYLEPVYANFSEHALHLIANEVVTTDFSNFDIPRFSLQQAGLLDVAGSAQLNLPEEGGAASRVSADVVLRDSSVAYLYDNLVRVALAGTLLGDLETDGRLSGSMRITDNAPNSINLQLNDVILDDRRGRFALYGLQGNIEWHADGETKTGPSLLRWDSGAVYNILIGSAELPLQLGDNDVEFLAPLRLATMGGALLINELELHNFGTDAATGRLDAELQPIQLGQLTGTFGWPAFSGTLSGRLPLLRLAENTITVGGTLSAQAFDGTMEMSNLRIEQPFGRVPRMQGDLAFRNLDLQRVTEAFSFGLIQGRLSGDVTALRMQNWRPVAMDMNFYTPINDRSLHRISQRAVENLASVGGGGAAAALSTGFLQFFEVFAYDRIGLRCVLNNGVCTMSGAGPAKSGTQGSGYYIVKGSGIPRIDVVGYRNTVSWPKLVQQLAAITRSGSPTVN
ncbi:MAG: hypothetical protein HKN77_06180 [Woeseiaceae bacterium]|nr:hypothetical protein [Woeseiaceae bacterium]